MSSHRTSAEVSEYLTNLVKLHKKNETFHQKLMQKVGLKAVEVRREKNKEQSLIRPFEEIEEIDQKMT